MQITFLIGNGFDISCGIKSSYSDFYTEYCSKESPQKHISDFRQEIQNEIDNNIADEDKTWSDFEVGLGKYTKEFTEETVDNFLECLEDGRSEIIAYLRNQERNFRPDIYTDEEYKRFSQSIKDFLQDVTDLERPAIQGALNKVQRESKEIKFLTFNYTNTLERILEKIPQEPLATWRVDSTTYSLKINPDVLHVHGKIDDFPILGVNDEGQIANKKLLETPQFQQIMLKADAVSALGKTWHQDAEAQISKSKVICVFGMSLGETDAKWWRKIYQWLKADSSRHLIIYWYEKEAPNGISVTRQLRCYEKVKSKFLGYVDAIPKETQEIKSRIHIVINTPNFLRLKHDGEEVPESKEPVAVR